MNATQLMSEFDMSPADHQTAIDNIVSVAMYDRAAQIEKGSIASLINDCRLGAIRAMQPTKGGKYRLTLPCAAIPRRSASSTTQ